MGSQALGNLGAAQGRMVQRQRSVLDELLVLGLGALDLPPPSRASLKLVKSVNQPENDGYEEEQIQRGTDHWVPSTGRGRHAYQGALPQRRLQ